MGARFLRSSRCQQGDPAFGFEYEPMTSYFSGFVDFVGAHPHYALTAVFLLALSEAIPVIGTVVPGSTLIVGISALATAVDVNPWLLLVAATGGALRRPSCRPQSHDPGVIESLLLGRIAR